MTSDVGMFWVVDVEGSGSSPPELVEMALVQLRELSLTGAKRHWLIRPEGPIQPMATRIHGLSDEDVTDAPSIADIEDDVLECLDGASIVGHNVKVDLDVISRSIVEWRPIAAFDTLRLAKSLRPGLKSYSLANLGAEFDLSARSGELTGATHHSAIYDATLAALLFIHLLSPLTAEARVAALADANILDSRQGELL